MRFRPPKTPCFQNLDGGPPSVAGGNKIHTRGGHIIGDAAYFVNLKVLSTLTPVRISTAKLSRIKIYKIMLVRIVIKNHTWLKFLKKSSTHLLG